MSYHHTVTGIAAAINGTPRAKQDVIVSSKVVSDGYFRAIVLVVPAGQETGTRYEVNNQRVLDQLMFGRTPEWLGLEEYKATEADEDEFEREFDLRAHSRAPARAIAFGR